MLTANLALRAFGSSTYEIFDEDFERTRELRIQSESSFAPAVGELLNIEVRGVLRELQCAR